MKNKLLRVSITSISLCIVLGGVYSFYIVQHITTRKSFGEAMVLDTTKYEQTGSDGSILILGDSLAYGVGTTSPEQSFAGKIGAAFPNHTIVNNAVVGYDTEDLAINMQRHIDQQHEALFVIIGGNDIIRYRANIEESKGYLAEIIETASNSADQTYLITTGDFDAVSIVPWGLDNFYSKRSQQIRTHSLEISANYDNVTYIDAFDAFPGDYSKLEAGDGFHLNDGGIDALVDLTLSTIQNKQQLIR